VDRDSTTTTFKPLQDDDRQSAWYLLVAVGESSRVVPMIDGANLGFGRVSENEIALDHEGVSRRHAVFRRRGDVVLVEDLESRNGTFVNGTQITGSRRLVAGDVVSIGPASVVLATASPARSTKHVATIDELDERLDAEVERALRYHRALALVMIRFDGPAEPVAAHVDAVNQQLRRMDLCAEYGANEFALLLPETDRVAADAVAARARAAGLGIVAHVGIATFPEDGSHAGELVSIARDRLRGARAVRPRGRPTATPARGFGKHVVIADPQMHQVFEFAKRVAPLSTTVLVVGETGSGKEVVAEAVHRHSPRASSPYVRLNCASLSESLVEAELFGHEKGAFTGAVATKAGFFEAAGSGTLFLDEIGELPLNTQAKLLRVLEQHCIMRVGGTTEIPVDARLVCATNRQLELEVKNGRFREDLFFRISTFVIPVPPLRDRPAEIPLLAQQFIRELSAELADEVATISPEALALLSAYDWPGNVRELRNFIERAIVLSEGGRIEAHHFTAGFGERAQSPFVLRKRAAALDRDDVTAALDANGGNQTRAARQLGISRFSLIRLMDKFELKQKRS
jgi:DNA-binding NtrC family response regulator